MGSAAWLSWHDRTRVQDAPATDDDAKWKVDSAVASEQVGPDGVPAAQPRVE